MVIGDSILLFCVFFVSIIPIFFLKRAKQKWHANTYKLQVKLYKAVLIQLWVMSFLILVSLTLICLFLWLRIQNTAIVSQLLIANCSLHGPLDLTIIGYVEKGKVLSIEINTVFTLIEAPPNFQLLSSLEENLQVSMKSDVHKSCREGYALQLL